MGGRRKRSKKRSGANSLSTEQPERYEFFVDECVAAPHVAAMLRDAGHIAFIHGMPETFTTGTLDVDWLPIVGAHRWVVITKDKNIRKRQIELRAYKQSGVRVFVFTGAN